MNLKELTLECPTSFNINSEETRAQIKKLAVSILKVFEDIKSIVIKICEVFKRWVKENPWILKYILKKSKYEKRVINRNKLYIKRKKLGRK